MENNYGEMYRNQEYAKLIETLNPSQDPNKQIYKWATFYYAWSIERTYLHKQNFYYKLERKRFEYLVNEILRNIPSDHMLIELVESKKEIYYKMEREGKVFPTASGPLSSSFVPYSKASKTYANNESKYRKYKPKKEPYVPYAVFGKSNQESENSEYEDSKYEFDDRNHDFDDIAAIEQGNLDWE